MTRHILLLSACLLLPAFLKGEELSAASREVVGEYECEHPNWKGKLELKNDGRFQKDNDGEEGTWRYTGRQLTLQWDRSKSEYLKPDGRGNFVSTWGFTMRRIGNVPAPSATERQPIPAPDQLSKAEALIKDQFKQDFKKLDPADQIALADKLVEFAVTRAAGDSSVQYSALQMAIDLALKRVSPETLFRAVDALRTTFDGDPIETKFQALERIRHSVMPKEQTQQLAAEYLSLSGEAWQLEDYAAAAKFSGTAELTYRAANDLAATAIARQRFDQIAMHRIIFDKVKLAQEKLFENPDDPDGNLVYGRYICFVREDWGRGLPHLSKGNDARLAAAAKAELASPAKADQQTALADRWWDALTSANAQDQETIKLHASLWYGKAWPALQEAERTRIDKRLAAVQFVRNEARGKIKSGVSQRTRAAIPTSEEMTQLKDYGIAKRNGDTKASENAYTLHSSLQTRLNKDPEIWSDEDFDVRRSAAAKLESAFSADFGYRREWKPPTAYASSASTPEQFVRRLQYISADPKQVRVAIHDYLARNSDSFPIDVARRQFCDWLKTQKVDSVVIDEYVRETLIVAKSDAADAAKNARVPMKMEDVPGTYQIVDKAGKKTGTYTLRNNGNLTKTGELAQRANSWQLSDDGTLTIKWNGSTDKYFKRADGKLFNLSRDTNYSLIKEDK